MSRTPEQLSADLESRAKRKRIEDFVKAQIDAAVARAKLRKARKALEADDREGLGERMARIDWEHFLNPFK